jgi:hypothetical protein
MIEILIVIAVVGVIVYLLGLLPMPAPFRNILWAVAAILILLWVLQKFNFKLP